ncbi:hypothetical protein [Burkholderia glumae]|uniref:Uncharacterized protein n=1 Tax=Burkholderia glumae TaxID=337 RepID=A0AAP9Y8U2_BURGL|nr:hypothetical protein [Burkholderia glumae]ACR28783.1 Hypothetical protein bglu_1g16430 [Burkholderia glumae BGR1]AJY65755.1 hypothetical protein KS03_2537 [Burkholderia glumae LMG 2196 = ATCC 33617]MCM2483342.1 hypothetical protein [Burkholderia glumae]MCM2506659.1 hypothetical protein [Burkholderia glumae]MCM2538331.1 hypothetical protein [Burkholderia glumae]
MNLPTLHPLLRTLLAVAALATLAASHPASAQAQTFHFGEGQAALPGQRADGKATPPRASAARPQPAPAARRAPAHRPTHARSRHRARHTRHAAPPAAYAHH